MREAYSHEVSSCGFWPGAPGLDGPMFYSYAYPEPLGYRDAPVSRGPRCMTRTSPSSCCRTMPCAKRRDPDAYLLDFLQSTYEAAADLAAWDRPALEHRSQPQEAALY